MESLPLFRTGAKGRRGSAVEKSLADKAKHWRTGPQSYEDLQHSCCLWAVVLGKSVAKLSADHAWIQKRKYMEHDIPARYLLL